MTRSSRSDGPADEVSAPLTLLVVFPDEQPVLFDRLETTGAFVLRRARTVDEALAALDRDPVDCVVGPDGGSVLELVSEIRTRYPTLPVVVAAGDGSEQFAGEAIAAGATEYVPIDDQSETVDRLGNRIEMAVRENRGYLARAELDGLEAAVEHAADAIVLTDADGQIEYVNPAFEAVTGYTRASAIGRTPRILKSGVQDEAYYEEMWTAILAGDVWEETIVNERKDGTQYIAHQTVAPVTDETGSVEQFVGIQRDITRRRRLEEQIERSEAALSELYEIASDGDLGLGAKIEAVLSVGTRQFEFPLGYLTRIEDDRQEILVSVGETEQLHAGRQDPLERTYCRKTIESDEPVVVADAEAEGWADDPAFEQFGLRCYIGARVVVDGELYGTLCFGGEEPKDRMILEAQQSTVKTLANWAGYELERERRERKLEQQNSRLEKFASAVSHDLRNPLNVAQSRLALFEETGDEEHLEYARESHERMDEIIEETLTLAREGELVEETTAVSLETIARQCWRSVETREGTLTVAADAEIQAHPQKVRHIFENLLGNAVEHAGDGVTVEVGPTESGFYVADDGPGIEPSAREQVFEYGYTTSSGSGFGLSIVEMIADAHGWEVSITESDAGGARFEFQTDEPVETPINPLTR
jgi:PAS domain S-box-containing protein